MIAGCFGFIEVAGLVAPHRHGRRTEPDSSTHHPRQPSAVRRWCPTKDTRLRPNTPAWDKLNSCPSQDAQTLYTYFLAASSSTFFSNASNFLSAAFALTKLK